MRKFVFVFVAGVALAFVTSCNMENPLLTESKLPYGAPQFDKIRNEHYMPAFEQGIAEAKAEIDAITDRHLNGCPGYSSTLWKPTRMMRCRKLPRRSLRS